MISVQLDSGVEIKYEFSDVPGSMQKELFILPSGRVVPITAGLWYDRLGVVDYLTSLCSSFTTTCQEKVATYRGKRGKKYLATRDHVSGEWWVIEGDKTKFTDTGLRFTDEAAAREETARLGAEADGA